MSAECFAPTHTTQIKAGVPLARRAMGYRRLCSLESHSGLCTMLPASIVLFETTEGAVKAVSLRRGFHSGSASFCNLDDRRAFREQRPPPKRM